MRIVFLQTGDFREASLRFAETGEESYHAQRHSMEVVERLAAEHEHVSVVCISANQPYAERLPSGVETRGFRFYGNGRNMPAMTTLLDELRPTHVVLRFPDIEVLEACFARQATVLPTFADAFACRSGWRRFIDAARHRRLARQLNDPRVTHVGNHNVAASQSLAGIGVDPAKIVPWDWPRPHQPEDNAPLPFPDARPLRLLTVGAVSEAKGVGDAIRALARLGPGIAELTIVGGGALDEMRALAEARGVADRVKIMGRIPFAEVVPTMRAHDALVVFTRPEYAEGLPGVLYQGLAARLPIVASPHPVFRHYFEDTRDLLFAAAHTPEALARRIADLAADRALYERLSDGTRDTFRRIVLGTDWVELVERWCRGRAEDREWLAARTLARICDAES